MSDVLRAKPALKIVNRERAAKHRNKPICRKNTQFPYYCSSANSSFRAKLNTAVDGYQAWHPKWTALLMHQYTQMIIAAL